MTDDIGALPVGRHVAAPGPLYGYMNLSHCEPYMSWAAHMAVGFRRLQPFERCRARIAVHRGATIDVREDGVVVVSDVDIVGMSTHNGAQCVSGVSNNGDVIANGQRYAGLVVAKPRAD